MTAAVLGAAALFEAVHGRARLERGLDAGQALVDALPAGGDQVDEQCEVVHPRMTLGEQVALEPLEAADRLIREPAYLGKLAGEWPRLGAEALPQRVVESSRQGRFELGGRRGERLDLAAGAFEHGLGGRGIDAAGGGLLKPLLGPLDHAFVYARDDTVCAG